VSLDVADPTAVALRREEAALALLPLFFVSGATGLVYQTLWARELNHVFGTSTFAIATVLTAFMGGLALGGLLASTRADRVADPLRAYGLIEAGIGLYALAFPWIVAAITPVYLAAWRVLEPSPVEFAAIQAVLIGFALLVPTTLMGATLPLLARFAIDRLGTAGERVGVLYATNTAGAVFGTFVGGFVLLPWLGLTTTTWLAAAANLALGLLALALARWARGDSVGVLARVGRTATPAPARARTAAPRPGSAVFVRLLLVFVSACVVCVVIAMLPFAGVVPWLLGGALLVHGGVGAAFLVQAIAFDYLADEAIRPVAAEPFVPELGRVAIASGLAGFAALIYEVAWTRVLVLMLGASVYAFSVMLLAFLTGIALGGAIGGWLADRILRRFGPFGVLVILAVVEAYVGLFAYVTMYLFPEIPFWYVHLFDAFDVIDYPWMVQLVSLTIAGLVMFPPAVLMGIAFPLSVRAVIGDSDDLGAPVGRIYAANTVGGMVGAAIAGFVLLPWLQVQGTVLLAIIVDLLAAAVLLVGPPRVFRGYEGQARLGVLAMVVALGPFVLYVRPPWDPMLMTAGMYKYASELDPSHHDRQGILDYTVKRYELLYYAEGLSSVVTVARNPETKNIWLANNGKVDASTSLDMPTQVLVGLLPFQFVDDPEHVLVIGLASGITAGAVSQVDAVQRLDVCELEPKMPGATRMFDEFNHKVLDDPRLNLIANDGRNQVLLSAPGTYDIIVSEPSNPWLTGVSNLFTEEFLKMGRTRLKPHGVWSQWVQMYGMGDEDLRSLLATFAAVYPHVQLYATIDDADLVILGSDVPIHPSRALTEAMYAKWPAAGQELRRVGLKDADGLLATWIMGREGVLSMAGDAPLNTDDNMRIEYSAPLHLHDATSEENMAAIVERAEIPLDAYPAAEDLGRLARAYLAREDIDRSVLAMAWAVERQSDDPAIVAAARDVRDREPTDLSGALVTLNHAAQAASDADPGGEFTTEWLQWQDELVVWSSSGDPDGG
jgi:spermidine synthase